MRTITEAVITSALTFPVATTVHANPGSLHLPQMEALAKVAYDSSYTVVNPCMQTLMSAGVGAMTAVRSVSTLLDHTTATVSVAFS